jgi:hypothetical protein
MTISSIFIVMVELPIVPLRYLLCPFEETSCLEMQPSLGKPAFQVKTGAKSNWRSASIQHWRELHLLKLGETVSFLQKLGHPS